ncbi:heterokaryon incompatibility protein-domain-containing protein [Fusarium flagelliforme]|uniref:heterokaryon incompatibility protein-domain-containing protein n=1 Tax=Fusarium flagelliforme TaxID=2675880 RepID=UPI001E8E29AB|nr:heterokaryon incompatibility protein-domain-containing protein [Fusarium flagelliforme]KAH7174864.1 heterokaryon incompatibility protein-domain-containing protein [Fusarium flagelliforme]
MRLINTTTLEVEEFFDVSIPEYAILSHTWGDGEVSLQDWVDRKNRRFKPGFQKIIWACTQAVKDQLGHVWVDTNCIDKSSSAELSEAINSMFKWYRRSAVCYVYLEDVPALTLDECAMPDSAFRRAKWFTRGWTLQELIAPPNVTFFSSDWTTIATKSKLAPCITEITGIPWSCLLRGRLSKSHPLRKYSVDQRMSWASGRSTTRIEDQAYSLLGLFDISMPLVYGEGHEAFTRLLGQIIQKYADQSFFASRLHYVDFLPRSPVEFCHSQTVVVHTSPQLQRHYTPPVHSYPFNLTNTGLQITLPIVSTLVPHFVFGVLDCWDFQTASTRTARNVSRIWIPLLRKGTGEMQQYTRLIWPHTFLPVKMPQEASIIGVADQDRYEAATSATSSKYRPSTEFYTTSSEAPSPRHIDLVSAHLQRNILVRKPYAAMLPIPKWPHCEAESPFLLCFPRGIADYRLYGIFPREVPIDLAWLGEQPPQLPLVIPQPTRRIGEGVHADALYGVTVVFKKRRSRPGKFVAICLTNAVAVDPGSLMPSCKIIPDWSPSRDQDVDSMDLNGFGDVDAAGETLVTVQKVTCDLRSNSEGHEPRFIGLTQVVFDRLKMREELYPCPEETRKGSRGILDNYGEEVSEED